MISWKWFQKMTKLFVIGNPINHSKSPIIHNYWLEKHGVGLKYTKRQTQEWELPKLIEEVRDGMIMGFNVTIPFKQKILNLVDKLDISAKNSMAVNTVYKKGEKVVGANTDGKGFVDSLKKDLKLNFPENANVFFIGSGGAAYGIISEFLKIDTKSLYSNFSNIEITNRTKSNAKKLVKHFTKQLQTFDTEIGDLLEKKGNNVAQSFFLNPTKFIIRPWGFNPPETTNLLINTSALGMKRIDSLNFNLDFLSGDTFVYDIIYNPKETILLREARARGLSYSNGIFMLVRQAAESFQKWFDIKLTNKDIKEVVKLLGY